MFVCVTVVTQAGTVSVSAQPLPPMLKNATAEGFTSDGGPRSFVVCQTPHNACRPVDLLHASVLHCLGFSAFSAALQCENGLLYHPCGPACSPSCPSIQQSPHSQCATLSCVEGCFCPAGTVLHGKIRFQRSERDIHFEQFHHRGLDTLM